MKGGTGYIYKQSPEEKAAYDSQQSINTTRHGSLTPHVYDGNKDNRAFRWSAKPPPPVKSSFDTVILNWDRKHITSQARIQAHQAARLGELQKVNEARIAEEARQQCSPNEHSGERSCSPNQTHSGDW